MKISKYEDVIYSNEITDKIAELYNNDERDEEEESEYNALLELEAQCKAYNDDYDYGETLIRDSYFKEYAIELASEISDPNIDNVWPYNCIDWNFAAMMLKQDYVSVQYHDVTYWIRAT